MTNFRSLFSTNRTGRQFFLVLLVITVGLLGYWYYSQLEWEEKEVDLGYSKAAQRNPFLAAELFLRKQGLATNTIKNLTLLDTWRWRDLELGAEDTLVLINANKTLNDERYNRLYEWIESGGTLITSTQNPFVGSHTNEEDLLLRDFNIVPASDTTFIETQDFFNDADEEADNSGDNNEKAKPRDEEHESHTEKTSSTNTPRTNDSAGEKHSEQSKNYQECNLDQAPTEIDFGDETGPLHFDFTRQEAFSYRNDEMERDSESSEHDASANYEQSHLLTFDVGAGSITITSDNTIWSNRRIDCHDHAYALWRLINPNGRVWFLINQDAPSLAEILWRSSPYAVLASALALFLWLWAKASRFGPVFSIGQQGRRSLAEHIHASAMLLWRKQQHPQLLVLMRDDIEARLTQQYPQVFQENSRAHRIQLLHELTGLERTQIEHALFADHLYQPQAFAQAVATLQVIRKHL